MSMPGGGIVPPGAAPVDPIAAQAASRYAGLSTEQLQQIAAQRGATPGGGIAGRMLLQRHIMPQTQRQAGAPQGPTAIQQTPQATSAGVSLPPTTNAMRHGGGIAPRPHFDAGGAPFSSADTPYWSRQEARSADSGLIAAYSPGRTDTMNMEPLAGSYIIPADVISGLGEGNTLAGSAVMDRVLSSGPHGTQMPRGEHGRGPPQPPRIVERQFQAKGGTTEGADGSRVPIVAAGGEYKVSPDQVRALGRGNIKRGHDILDHFVLEVRRRTVRDLKKLPPPKKD